MKKMIKFDEEGNITEEWSEYVRNLDREDLETYFIGADALIKRVTEFVENYMYQNLKKDDDKLYEYITFRKEDIEDLLGMLKGDPKSF